MKTFTAILALCAAIAASLCAIADDEDLTNDIIELADARGRGAARAWNSDFKRSGTQPPRDFRGVLGVRAVRI